MKTKQVITFILALFFSKAALAADSNKWERVDLRSAEAVCVAEPIAYSYRYGVVINYPSLNMSVPFVFSEPIASGPNIKAYVANIDEVMNLLRRKRTQCATVVAAAQLGSKIFYVNPATAELMSESDYVESKGSSPQSSQSN
jgi:hypothetical protein